MKRQGFVSGSSSTSKPEPETDIAARIKLLIGDESVSAFARRSDIGESLMRQYLSGSIPGADKLVQVARAGNANIEWLATGEGPMRRGYGKPVAESFSVQEPAPGYEYLPLYDVQAAAGHGSLVEREDIADFLAFKSAWIRRELGADPKDLYLISVEGDSMEPTLRPGDVILVDRRQAWRIPKDGVYVLLMDGSLLVKRLQSMPGGIIKVTSDNPSYSPFQLEKRWVDGEQQNDADGSGVIGRVVWAGHRM